MNDLPRIILQERGRTGSELGVLIPWARLFGCQQKAATAETVVKKEKERRKEVGEKEKEAQKNREKKEGRRRKLEEGDQCLTQTLIHKLSWVHF